jgi:CO/xanthine dehydrogenase Mo-binding subunit
VLVLDREFETQSVDPMALEPEAGLAWYDPGRKKLELVLGSQSPHETGTAIAYLLGEASDKFKPASINAQFAHIGGGFGCKDHTPFPRCSSPATRSGLRTTATSSSRAA